MDRKKISPPGTVTPYRVLNQRLTVLGFLPIGEGPAIEIYARNKENGKIVIVVTESEMLKKQLAWAEGDYPFEARLRYRGDDFLLTTEGLNSEGG